MRQRGRNKVGREGERERERESRGRVKRENMAVLSKDTLGRKMLKFFSC